LVASADPLAVAHAFRDRFGASELYVADLAALRGEGAHLDTLRALAVGGFRMMVDAGLRDAASGRAWLDAGAKRLVAGLETAPGPELLSELVTEYEAQRIVFSLDLWTGRPLDGGHWGTNNPIEIARQAFERGVRSIIVLDLAGVGSGAGAWTAGLCAQLCDQFAGVEVITGGGVRGLDDLRLLEDAGVAGVLVASALHDGTLTAAEVRGFM
jgi:phosphoribosylformimino-5-aminoimidazole carboxamide ribotide isomerase